MNCDVKLERNPDFDELRAFLIKSESHKLSELSGSALNDEMMSIGQELREAITSNNVFIFTLRVNEDIKGILFLRMPSKSGEMFSTILYAYIEPEMRRTKCGAKLFYVSLCVVSEGLGLTIKYPEWIPNIKSIRDMYDLFGLAVIGEDVRKRLNKIFRCD